MSETKPKKVKKPRKPLAWKLPKWRTLGSHHRKVGLLRAAGVAGVFAIRRNTVKKDDGAIVVVGKSSDDPVHELDLREAILRHVDLGTGMKPVEPYVTRGIAEVCFKKVRNVQRLDEALRRLRVLIGLDCSYVDERGAPCLKGAGHLQRDTVHACAATTDGKPILTIADYEAAARLGLVGEVTS